MSVFARQTSRFSKLKNVGDAVRGTLLEVSEPRQATKFNRDPNAPRVLDFWEATDGGAPRPKMEVILTLQTQLNEGPDSNGDPDDGQRKLVIPVFYKDGSMLSALQRAMIGAGAKDLEIGADLGLRHTGHDPESANMDNPRKLYEAYYKRPAGGGGVFQQQTEQHQPPAAQQQAAAPAQQWQPPAAQPAAAPAQQWQPPAAQGQQGQQGQQWPAPTAVNPNTGEVGGQPQLSYGGQTASGQQVHAEPGQEWQTPPQAYVPPANPTPEQQAALAHFPNAPQAAASWQPPAAQPAAAPAPAPVADVAAIQTLIAQGAPNAYIVENVPNATDQGVAAIRNMGAPGY